MNITTAPFTVTSEIVIDTIQTRDFLFTLPLDYEKPRQATIQVFAREVVSLENKKETDLPVLIFFQGGPGFPSPRPAGDSGWLGEALKKHRVILLDQRGTGRSTPVLPQTLARFPSPQEQAEYLTHFRADNIVRDAETIRHSLLGPAVKWIGMGQSYGGFCLLTYLSFHPEGLAAVIITGGVAGIFGTAEDNYRLTYKKVIEKNDAYYRRYPQDDLAIREIVKHLSENTIQLPSGGILSPRRFQALGLAIGMSGGFETIHYLIEKAWVDGPNGRELSYDFLRGVENQHAFDTNPIFCILHESIYAEHYATGWASESLRDEFPEIQINPNQRLIFTGEMISPAMLEDFANLRPLKECAQILAEKSDWTKLYDLDQLAQNTVPIAAISYYDDMYVPIELSRQTALHIPHFKQWITNEWEHNGIGIAGDTILRKLLRMLL